MTEESINCLIQLREYEILIVIDWDLNRRTPYEILEMLIPPNHYSCLEQAHKLVTANISAFFQASVKFWFLLAAIKAVCSNCYQDLIKKVQSF